MAAVSRLTRLRGNKTLTTRPRASSPIQVDIRATASGTRSTYAPTRVGSGAAQKTLASAPPRSVAEGAVVVSSVQAHPLLGDSQGWHARALRAARRPESGVIRTTDLLDPILVEQPCAARLRDDPPEVSILLQTGRQVPAVEPGPEPVLLLWTSAQAVAPP